MSKKIIKILNFIFIYLILILLIIINFSCIHNSKIIKSYSYYPSKDEIDNIFKTRDLEKIMKYYLFFQSSDDKEFIDKLNFNMSKFLSDNLDYSINQKKPINEIIRDFNNYLFFYKYIVNKNIDEKSIQIENYNLIIENTFKYLFNKINEIENYYYFNSYISYLEILFPFYKDKIAKLKEKKFDEKYFISSYEDVYKNNVMVVLDKGIKIENGQSIPDISIGSGFFIDYNKIVTNYHVVNSDGEKFLLSVKINSLSFPANIILLDESYDLAILEIPYENKEFKFFKLSEKIKIGDEVIVSGNPYGLSFSNTKGIISNIYRKFLEVGNVIQIDAPLNPGNSGGPVFKTNFELIGIAFASISNTQNLNFILPAYFMMDAIIKINTNIELQRSWLGFYFYEDKILYQVKGTANYNLLKINDIDEFAQLKFLYQEDNLKLTKDFYMSLQHYICLLPEYSFVPVEYHGKKILLLTERRPKYPINFAIANDDLNNCLNIIFDANIVKQSEYYKIEKIFNPEISLFYGINPGDLIKVITHRIQSQKKVIILYLNIKRSRYGYALQQLSIALSFSQPGFF